MATRTPAEVFADLVRAGFTSAQATIMTAIAEAESSLDDANVGDVALQDNTWGPSYGLYQIRTVKGDTGRGTDRDINALAGDDARQAQAAWDISQHGRDFSPWTVYTSGAYQQYLGQARAAAGQVGANPGLVTPVGDGSNPFPTWGPKWLPWNWPSDAGNAASARAQQALGGARTIAIEAVFVLLGLALVGGGLAQAVEARIQRQAKTAAKVAKAVI